MNLINRLYLGTIASDAAEVAKEYGTGLEIDEYCSAVNMDPELFSATDRAVREKMTFAGQYILHAPFNELCPAAIDPKALELAYQRLEQAYRLAKDYNIKRMVVHSGYVPQVYFKSWFSERSIEFWKNFMRDKPEDFYIMIENVLEDEPYTMAEMLKQLGDHRIGACLDIGHAHCSSNVDLMDWVSALGPFLHHVHIHNNNKEYDQHWDLGRGNIDMNRIMEAIRDCAPGTVTYTIENVECRDSMRWLSENGWIG